MSGLPPSSNWPPAFLVRVDHLPKRMMESSVPSSQLSGLTMSNIVEYDFRDPHHNERVMDGYAEMGKASKAKEHSGSSSPAPDGKSPKLRMCVGCSTKKPIGDFPKHSSNTDGVASYCRDCKNRLAKERRLKDPVARITHYTVTRIKNEWPKEKVPKDIQTNLEHYLGYKLIKLVTKLRTDLRVRENISIFEAFKRGYHLDHLKAHTTFNSQEIGDEDFKACWAIKNLWLIPAQANLKKGAKDLGDIEGSLNIVDIRTAASDEYADDEGDGLDE